MKKRFQPLRIEIYLFDEADMITTSKNHTGPIIPAAFYNRFDDDFIL